MQQYDQGQVPIYNQIIVQMVDPTRVMPPSMSCRNDLYPQVPLALSTLVDYLQARAKEGRWPLRIALLNILGQNGYRNQEFTEAFVYVMDYIGLAIATNSVRSIQDAVITAVGKITDILCYELLMRFPALAQTMDATTYQGVMAVGRDAVNIIQELRQYRMNNYVIPQQHQQAPSLFHNQNNPAVYQGNPGFHQQQQAAFQQRQGQQPSGMGSLFTTMDTNNTRVSHAHSRFGDHVQQPLSGQPAPDSSSMVVPIDTRELAAMRREPVEVEIKDDPSLVWFPTAYQYYMPVYDPHVAQVSKFRDEKGIVRFDYRKKDPNMFDYQKHYIPTIFGHVPDQLPYDPKRDRQETVMIGSGIMNEYMARHNAATEKEALCLPPAINGLPFEDTSIESAIAFGEECWYNRAQETPIFRAHATIVTTAYAEKDERAFIESVHESKTFLELHEKLNASYGEISRSLSGKLINAATDMVNRVLAQNMSIQGARIDSFIGDLPDMINLLRDNYGEAIKSAFLKRQQKQIAGEFNLFPLARAGSAEREATMIAEKVTENTITMGTRPQHAAIFCQDISITFLDITSHELCITLEKGIGNIVVESYVPLLYSVITGMFMEEDMHRRFIVTSDSRVLEATLGNLVENAYLLTLIR